MYSKPFLYILFGCLDCFVVNLLRIVLNPLQKNETYVLLFPFSFYLCNMNLMWSIVFFLLPLVGCGYVGWHIWTILPLPVWCKWTVLIVLAVCFLCMFLNLMVGLDSMPPLLARVMYEVGFSSIFVLLYLVMIFLLLDLGRLLHLVPVSFLHQSAVGSVTLLTVMLGIFIYGNLHYYNKVRVPIYLNTDKPLARDYKLVMISDLHLGYHNTRDDLAKWVDLINAEHADAVFIAGDIVDFSVVPIIRTGMARELFFLKTEALFLKTTSLSLVVMTEPTS